MWRPTQLVIKGFGIIDVASIPLDNRGLVNIGASNKDIPSATSNMSGKSTILHALTWCLYECDTLGKKLADIAIHHDMQQCEVSLHVCDEDAPDHCVIITRERMRNRHDGSACIVSISELNLLTNGWQTKSGAASAMQTYIDKIFGPRDLFLACHIFGYDEEYVPFARLPDKSQKSFFDLLIDAEDLDVAYERCKELIRNKERLTIELDKAKAAIESKRHTIVGFIEKAKEARKEDADIIRAELEDVKRLGTEAANTVAGYEAQLRTIEAEIDSVEVRINAIEQLGRGWKLSTARLQERLSSTTSRKDALTERKCPTCGGTLEAEQYAKLLTSYTTQENEIRAELAACGPDPSIAREEEQKILNTKMEALIGTNTSVNNKLQSAKDLRATLRGRYDELNKTLIETEKKTKAATGHTYEGLMLLEAVQHIADKRIKTLQRELEILTFWETGFGRNGLRAYRLDRLTPMLNELAIEYSGELFGDGTHIRYSTQTSTKDNKFRDKFSVAVCDKNGYLIERISAGQAMRRDLVHLFSIVSLADRLGKRTLRLLCFDESFRTLDNTGVHCVISVLRKMLCLVETIIVIEHSNEMASLFDAYWLVVRSSGKATVETGDN